MCICAVQSRIPAQTDTTLSATISTLSKVQRESQGSLLLTSILACQVRTPELQQ